MSSRAEILYPFSQEKELAETAERAHHILTLNKRTVDRNGEKYDVTIPSNDFYVHQWNWDSATHAMALIHLSPKRAYDEILSLISGQHADTGLIPHIVFNPDESQNVDKIYFPGPTYWGTEKYHKGNIETSGITQPPLLAISLDYIDHHAPKDNTHEAFIEQALPAVIKFHDGLKKFRDPDDSGLIIEVHPWATGRDNNPATDKPLLITELKNIPQRVNDMVDKQRTDDSIGKKEDRPSLDYYYRVLSLVDLFKSWGWDYEKIVAESPFAVKDMLTNSLWARANESLAQTLERRGQYREAKKYKGWAEQTKNAIAKTWNNERKQYCDQDVSFDPQTGKKRNEPLLVNTIATFAPLLAGAVTQEQLPYLLDKLEDPQQYGSSFPIPSTALNDTVFNNTCYWRGPSWPITNLFTINGLERYANDETISQELRERCRTKQNNLIDSTLTMISEQGFWEYFDPQTGKGHGRPHFSWTAAIYLYLYENYRKQKHERDQTTSIQ
ncbi:MAG TPA: trehalase family glycosidase [Methylomirabilota bacterium]|nr:trehalase family glycosidase [Methylomirabilota bacterium]